MRFDLRAKPVILSPEHHAASVFDREGGRQAGAPSHRTDVPHQVRLSNSTTQVGAFTPSTPSASSTARRCALRSTTTPQGLRQDSRLLKIAFQDYNRVPKTHHLSRQQSLHQFFLRISAMAVLALKLLSHLPYLQMRPTSATRGRIEKQPRSLETS